MLSRTNIEQKITSRYGAETYKDPRYFLEQVTTSCEDAKKTRSLLEEKAHRSRRLTNPFNIDLLETDKIYPVDQIRENLYWLSFAISGH
jgi:hypothetical protein